MTNSDDYLTEMMFHRNTDTDIERLFDGSLDPDSDLASVADLLGSLRATSNTPLDDTTVATFAQAASSAAAGQRVLDGSTAAPSHAATSQRRPGLVSLRHRVASLAVAAGVFVMGLSGVAVAADNAKPGDALYGIDRAFEAVGIGNGQAAERVMEVQALFDADDFPRGLQHAADLVDVSGPDHSAASIALMDAANRVVSQGSEASAATREMVAPLLTYLSGAGNIDGPTVARLAREIGRPHAQPDPDSAGNRPPAPPGRPDFAPGRQGPPSNRP
ncbi:MAG: hypothetical protein QGM47_02070 [Actinomycetota bacterium]|nr:hypothetical protein [Actinomycetota bacterium]